MLGIYVIWMIKTVFVAFDCPIFKLNIFARVALFLIIITGELARNFVENIVTAILATVLEAVFEQTVVRLAIIDTKVWRLHKTLSKL